MKLLRPLAGYTLYDHKTNDYIRRELRITGILDKADEYRRNWLSHLQKNATKPNLFEIIPLQTTRKENNWKTEEALARAAVTVETERIKGSNPWCLWWWWTVNIKYIGKRTFFFRLLGSIWDLNGILTRRIESEFQIVSFWACILYN